MRIDFLFWRDCPSHPEARELLRDVLEERGVEAEIVEREVFTQDEAEELAFPGSPTIRIDGRDIVPPEDGEPYSLTCRVYRRRDGRISPVPDPEDVRDAVRRAA